MEDVFDDRDQVDLLADGEPALVTREDERRADEMLGDEALGVIHCDADIRRHATQVAGGAAGVAQDDVDGGRC
jgi:hypothetical protein